MRGPESRPNRRRMRAGRLGDERFFVMSITKGQDRARACRYPPRIGCDPAGSCSLNLARQALRRAASLPNSLPRETWRKLLVGKPRWRDPSHGGYEPAKPRTWDDQCRTRIPARTEFIETFEVLAQRLALCGRRPGDVRHVDDPGRVVARAKRPVFACAKAGTELFVGRVRGKSPSVEGHQVIREPRMVDLNVFRGRLAHAPVHSDNIPLRASPSQSAAEVGALSSQSERRTPSWVSTRRCRCNRRSATRFTRSSTSPLLGSIANTSLAVAVARASKPLAE